MVFPRLVNIVLGLLDINTCAVVRDFCRSDSSMNPIKLFSVPIFVQAFFIGLRLYNNTSSELFISYNYSSCIRGYDFKGIANGQSFQPKCTNLLSTKPMDLIMR